MVFDSIKENMDNEEEHSNSSSLDIDFFQEEDVTSNTEVDIEKNVVNEEYDLKAAEIRADQILEENAARLETNIADVEDFQHQQETNEIIREDIKIEDNLMTNLNPDESLVNHRPASTELGNARRVEIGAEAHERQEFNDIPKDIESEGPGFPIR